MLKTSSTTDNETATKARNHEQAVYGILFLQSKTDTQKPHPAPPPEQNERNKLPQVAGLLHTACSSTHDNYEEKYLRGAVTAANF